MLTNSHIKKLLLKIFFSLTIIILSPQISFCWNVTEYDGYVRAEEGYNGGYKFTLALTSDGKYPYSFWQIEATSENLQKWIELSNISDLKYELFVDGNHEGANYSINLTYDKGSNFAFIRGYLSEPLLKAIQKGTSLSIRYKNLLDRNSLSLISLDISGSGSAINDLKIANEKSIRDKLNREYAYIGIASLIGLFVVVKILGWAFRKTKTIAKTVTNTSHEISVIVKNKVAEARRNRLYNKIEESVLDEIVREAVRQAIREGVKPDAIKLCTECFGGGCHQCDNKGWTA